MVSTHRVVADRRGNRVVQVWVKTVGTIGGTQRADGGYWLTRCTVAQALSPTYNRACNS